MWMYGLARDIERLVGKEAYLKYGQEIIDCLRDDCEMDDHEMRYPSDEEIIAVVNEIVGYHNK
jgi:hypothetical protein